MKINAEKALKSIKKWLISLHLGCFIGNYLEDICLFSGLFFIIFATFQINRIAGFYCIGACLFGLGVYFTKNPIKKGQSI